MLPSKISATNLELLLRNPYGFYAKNLLNLRKLDSIAGKNNLSHFGNFIHKTIETYTNNYDASIADKYKQIVDIGIKIAREDYKKQQVNLWLPKFKAVAREFLDFDEERRAKGVQVFAEIYGEMTLDILGKNVLITAIADRVEVDREGKIYILDYKTGALPAKQDVARGISVQMLTEAMIAGSSGFAGVNGEVAELIYVKIASRAPYIAAQILRAEEYDLTAHKEGLIKVLSYYAKGEEYLVNDNKKFAPRYDDYRHLAREE